MYAIESNDIVKTFNYSSMISAEDNQTVMKIIEELVRTGNYFKNSPRYQTNVNLFKLDEPIWLKYRLSFLFSVFMYLGREVKVNNMMAWSFMTNLEGAEDRETLWHNHWHPQNPNAKMLSGILYLHIPKDVANRETCGTELAPMGPESDEKFFIGPNEYTWNIYPSDTWHRPGVVQSMDYRFIIAVDIEYIL
jgi:hypothetical protein